MEKLVRQGAVEYHRGEDRVTLRVALSANELIG